MPFLKRLLRGIGIGAKRVRDRRTLRRATKLRRRSAKGRTQFQRSLRRR